MKTVVGWKKSRRRRTRIWRKELQEERTPLCRQLVCAIKKSESESFR